MWDVGRVGAPENSDPGSALQKSATSLCVPWIHFRAHLFHLVSSPTLHLCHVPPTGARCLCFSLCNPCHSRASVYLFCFLMFFLSPRLASGFSRSFHRCVVSAKASFLSPLFLKVFRSGLDEGKRGQKRFVPCNMKPLLPICVRVHNDIHS